MAKVIPTLRCLKSLCVSPLRPGSHSLSWNQVQVMLGCTHPRCFSNGSSGDGIFDPEDMTPPIPPYAHRTGESVELKRARLLYQSRKRGMLENGLLLSTFAGKYLNSLNDDQLNTYDKLINEPTNDWEIYYWVTGAKETPEEYLSDIMTLLQTHAKNEEKDSRIRQPDL